MKAPLAEIRPCDNRQGWKARDYWAEFDRLRGETYKHVRLLFPFLALPLLVIPYVLVLFSLCNFLHKYEWVPDAHLLVITAFALFPLAAAGVKPVYKFLHSWCSKQVEVGNSFFFDYVQILTVDSKDYVAQVTLQAEQATLYDLEALIDFAELEAGKNSTLTP